MIFIAVKVSLFILFGLFGAIYLEWTLLNQSIDEESDAEHPVCTEPPLICQFASLIKQVTGVLMKAQIHLLLLAKVFISI